MRGSRSVKVFVLMLSVGLTGVALYATSPKALKASKASAPTPQNWVHIESGIQQVETEDLAAIAAKSNGAFVVGTGGAKVNVEIDDTCVVDETGTSTDLIAAHFRHPYLLISGFDYVGFNKFDGGGWQDLVSTPSSGNIYTTVYGTADRAFFGWPGLTPLAFDYLCYQELEGDSGMCRMVTSPVMYLTETSMGIGGVLKNGNILEWSLDLASESVIHDQPNDQQLDIVRGGIGPHFSSEVQALNRLGAGSYEYCRHPGTPGGTWTRYPIPYTMDAYGIASEPGPSPRQDIVVVGGYDGTDAIIVSTWDGGLNWRQEATDLPVAANNPLADVAVIPDAFGVMAVGDSATVLFRRFNNMIFYDGFERGHLSVWSVVIPPPTYTPTHTPTPHPWPTPTPTPTP